MDYIQWVKEREASQLSPHARRSNECLGRKSQIDPDQYRTEFERDEHRILHSLPFRRLKHKTQVFFAPRNDHICTRLEHALHVASVSSTICSRLRLNTDLARAIALAHDIGHPPFGHMGEKTLDRLHSQHHLHQFMHEAHGLRIIDGFGSNGDALNLTHEVRDGVVCHCGEELDQVLKPNRDKDMPAVSSSSARKSLPGTLEGCVVRMADRIAYLGRDFEDGCLAKLVIRQQLPQDVQTRLGMTNGEMIGAFVYDVIVSSSEEDKIALSDDVFHCMKQLSDFNRERIYNHPRILGEKRRISRYLTDLFDAFEEALVGTERGKKRSKSSQEYNNRYYREFFDFVKSTGYTDEEQDSQIVSDFIAGMTDNFAIAAFERLFLIMPPV